MERKSEKKNTSNKAKSDQISNDMFARWNFSSKMHAVMSIYIIHTHTEHIHIQEAAINNEKVRSKLVCPTFC